MTNVYFRCRRSLALGRGKLPEDQKFVDKCRIVAVGGKGGSGCVSFYRYVRSRYRLCYPSLVAAALRPPPSSFRLKYLLHNPSSPPPPISRDNKVQYGGPDGASGGNGGDIIIRAAKGLMDLSREHYSVREFQLRLALNMFQALDPLSLLRFSHLICGQYNAENGVNGQGLNKIGRHGKAQVVLVPVGTVVCFPSFYSYVSLQVHLFVRG